jgi:hypothetical protein
MSRRQCGYCGKYVPEQGTQCPFCREDLGPAPVTRGWHADAGRSQIRRGLLYMLLAIVIQYFAGGYSALEFPYTVIPLVQQYLLPFMFLAGMGMVIFGVYRRYFS